MLCSECFKAVERSKEIQIKGSIFCKECVESIKLIKRDVVAKCYYCFKLIFNDDIIHEVSKNWGSETSEKLMCCQSCYKKWLKVVNAEKNLWEAKKMSDATFAFSMWFLIARIAIIESKQNLKNENWFISFLAFMFLINGLSIPLVSWIAKKVSEGKLNKERKKFQYLRKKSRKLGISVIKLYWKSKQDKHGKIAGKFINELLGESWENDFINKDTEKDTIEKKDQLIKKIDDVINKNKLVKP